MRFSMTNLYYESHITIDPVYYEDLEEFKRLAAKYNFRVAELLMSKGGEKGVPSTQDSFCTSRSKDYTKITNDTIAMVAALQQVGFHVRRYKIEDTLVDSKIEDRFGLL
jgi:hypothetical protein